ncbi:MULTISPECIES: UDP-2,4-diacetamido-2,4,6-trideoxy-beta-L-altropyranose hydrolase [Sphingobium]|uniref:Glycosyl transferase family 28 C-terminal domain-containing protein n=1 Tax=Sphingobium chungbukense TaxID=56193 RepID=A0A0M3AL30_9SPHN|nr:MULTISPECIES: UDP-2,4-diacetamido-2,4,6-trideoxy-beta-L-altropyranose hydrolase [Sphingobium]AMK26079.1 RkpO, polysaccharide biosynthesis protein [Sphingobium sp. TKS]KKW90555.1 hypothetical protein YP76_18345 [Sphingobium chungbukense]
MTIPFSRVLFRADASLSIGTGHVMRCLTLANALVGNGAEVLFLCRDFPGHLGGLVRERGYGLILLPPPGKLFRPLDEISPAHASWLGMRWQEDAKDCVPYINAFAPDWLVVDHYALDRRWEAAVRPPNARLLVIDDLADREHDADILLDQNAGRKESDYAGLLPDICQLFVGPRFALLRPEFAEKRREALARRNMPVPRRILITLGGIDKNNATRRVLEALQSAGLPFDYEITVVMGASAPWVAEVRAAASQLPWPTRVIVNATNMAQIMAESDLAIGAAGSTSWERCALGLPTLQLVLAENQRDAARALAATGAAMTIDVGMNLSASLAHCLKLFDEDMSLLPRMAHSAAQICDGSGVDSLNNWLFDRTGRDGDMA